MSEFATIGKDLIIKALGRQANYIEESTDEINIEASGCHECEFYLKNGSTDNSNTGHCAFCDHKCYHVTKKYINEKNRFHVDDRLRLKLNAIKILIYLHFQQPDQNGIIKNIHVNTLAEALGVTSRTIINNFTLLRDYQYIYYCKIGCGTYNILINGYKERTKKNGPGYLVVNQKWLSYILKAEDINGLRICIRETLNIDNLNAKGGSFYNTKESPYSTIKRYLPSYYKRWSIIKTLEKNAEVIHGIFDFNMSQKSVRFTLKSECVAKKCREELLITCKDAIRSFMNEFNTNVNLAVTDDVENDKYKYLMNYDTAVKPISLSSDNVDNLAHLAVLYSYQQVEDALFIIHENYIMKNIPISNIGGLVRTIIEISANASIA